MSSTRLAQVGTRIAQGSTGSMLCGSVGTRSMLLKNQMIRILRNQTFNCFNSTKLNKPCFNHKLPLMHVNKVIECIYGGNSQLDTHGIGKIGSNRG
jgi:hypothetical protein